MYRAYRKANNFGVTLAAGRSAANTASAPIEALTRYDQRSVSIHERHRLSTPEPRQAIGRSDLIICKRTRPVFVLHERKSRVTLAARLIGRTAAETISVMLAVFDRIAPTLRKSITFDNDTAFAAPVSEDHARHDHLVL